MRTYAPSVGSVGPLVSLVCDRCQRVYAEAQDGRILSSGGAEFKASFGYGSRFDLEVWVMHLCDDCCERLRAEFHPQQRAVVV